MRVGSCCHPWAAAEESHLGHVASQPGCFWCVMVQEEDKVGFLHDLGVEGAGRLGEGSRPLCSSLSGPSNIQ